MNDDAQHYLRDLGSLVLEAARKSKGNAADDPFERGRLHAYFEVVSLMQQQAVAFGIPLASVGLNGVDPERDLL